MKSEKPIFTKSEKTAMSLMLSRLHLAVLDLSDIQFAHRFNDPLKDKEFSSSISLILSELSYMVVHVLR